MIPIHNILVPVDFKEPSKKALQSALALSRRFGSNVLIAHIVADPAITTGAFPTESHALAFALYEAAKKDVLNLIPGADELAQKVETIVKIGDIDAELLHIVREKSIDLVIMGTHGRRNPARWFIGSVTERMLRQLPVPVLTISHVEPEAVAMQHILYAADLRDESVRGFRQAAELAKATGGKLTVIHVVEHLEYVWAGALNGYMRAQSAELVKMTRKHLEEFVNREKPADLEVDWLVAEGHPYEEILRTADERHCDVIVMNLQGKNLVDRAFLGSTAERVVRLSHIPVLSIPISKPA
jgi:nucleotide-binding universal stress UspA family protein